MNVVDLLVALFAMAIGVRGYERGFAREGLEAASAVIGVFVAASVYISVGDHLASLSGMSPFVTRITVFLLVAVFLTAIGFLCASFVARRLEPVGTVGAIDGFLGLGFGFVKGLFYAGLIVVVLFQFPVGLISDALYGSIFGRSVATVAPAIFRFFPK